jgi:hypothetical protein
MNTIIAGRFDEQARAEQAMTALEATGFQREQIATFFVNPAGQHGDPERPAGESAYSERSRDEAPPRKSGMLVAIGAASSSEEASAITVLRAQGAADIERAQGSITQSRWNDFDPLGPPALVPVAA